MLRLLSLLSIWLLLPQSSQTDDFVQQINELSNKSIDVPMTRHDQSLIYISYVVFGQNEEGYYCNYTIENQDNKHNILTQKIVSFDAIKSISLNKKIDKNSKAKLLQIVFSESVVSQTFNNRENNVTTFAIPFSGTAEDYQLLVHAIQKLQFKKSK